MSDTPPSGFDRLQAALSAANALRSTRQQHNTPAPQTGDIWRARWNEIAVVVMLVGSVGPTSVVAAPVSLDSDTDEAGQILGAEQSNLGIDAVIWSSDDATIPVRVLDYKIGEVDPNVIGGLPRGSVNWGPTDPRTRTRAAFQDALEALTHATWLPDEVAAEMRVDLHELLANADFDEVVEALGSVPLASRLRRGGLTLDPAQAERLAAVLKVPADRLMSSTRTPLPDDLVAAMDQPHVRSLVSRLAAREGANEVQVWSKAAFGVFGSLAARDQDRHTGVWQARVRAYFEAHLPLPNTDELEG